MKTLILVRHAKSSWKDASLADRDRPLNQRGRRDAPAMGRRLAERGVEVDAMLTSPAVRALTTAQAIAEAIGYPPDGIAVDERLYHASASDWLDVIQDLDDVLDRVMCFGHNPGLTVLVNHLGLEHVDNVPTCGVVEFQFDVPTWAHVGCVTPVRVDLDTPKRGA